MVLPNYRNGSIVNLMSSIEKAFGGKPMYKPLRILKPKDIEGNKNLILMVIDGLGFEYLKKYGRNSTINKHLKGSMTSVFPATTASAITTFQTGAAPQQHAITGWNINIKEVGAIVSILKFTPRIGGISLGKIGVQPKDIFHEKPIFDRIKIPSYTLMDENILNSEYNYYHNSKSKNKSHVDLKSFFHGIIDIVKQNQKRKFVYAYWHKFDSICHKYGVKSKEALVHFNEIDQGFSAMLKSLEGTDSTIIMTADHGLIDIKKRSIIWLNKHLLLAKTLSMPLAGEPRAVYCHVRPGMTKQFESYVKTKLKGKFRLHKGSELIKKNYFGLHKPNAKLHERVGDYVLIAEKDYMMKDLLSGEEKKTKKGHHGGLSPQEMLVPLVVART